MRVLLFISLVFVISCNNHWEKDPFYDQSEDVQNGVPPEKQVKPLPPLKDVVFIDADQFYEFSEGEEASIQFKYRIAHPDLKFVSFEIPGVEQTLNGSKFDQATNTLTWTPADEYIPSGGFYVSIPVELVLTVDYKGVFQEYRQKTSFNVLRSAERPKITNSNSRITVSEGRSKSFRIVVEDSASTDGNSVYAPNLVIVSNANPADSDASRFVSINGRPTHMGNGRWRYIVMIDLKNQEVTKNTKEMKVGLQAFSSLGVPSAVSTQRFRVVTELSKPQLDAAKKIEFHKNVNNVYTFSVVDPKKEGRITTKFSNCSFLGSSASCKCDRGQAGAFQQVCTFRFTPTKIGSKTLRVRAENYLNTIQGSQNKIETMNIRVNIVNAPGGNP